MSEAAPSTRALLLQAAVLVAAALAVGAWHGELGGRPRALFEAPLPLQAPGPLEEAEEDAPVAEVLLSPLFDLEGPTTVRLRLVRDGAPGWVAADVALVSEDALDVRAVRLVTRVVEGRRVDDGALVATALIDQVPAGRYSLRVAPSWGEPGGSGGMPTARLEVVEGARSGASLALVVGLLAAPPLVVAARRVVARRRGRGEAAGEPHLGSTSPV